MEYKRMSCQERNNNSQIKMRKEKKKEETERERMERLNREYNDIDWAGLYNSDKLSSLRVDELSLYFSHHKITFKGKKAEKVAMIKAHIGSLLYDSMECQQPRQPLQGNLQQQVTSSLSEVETDSQSDEVDLHNMVWGCAEILSMSIPSSAKQQREITQNLGRLRTETSTAKLLKFFFGTQRLAHTVMQKMWRC